MSFVWHLALWRREWRERSFCWPWVSAKYQKMQSTQLSTEKRRRNLLLFTGSAWSAGTHHMWRVHVPATGQRTVGRGWEDTGESQVAWLSYRAPPPPPPPWAPHERECAVHRREKKTQQSLTRSPSRRSTLIRLSLEPVVFLQKSATKKKEYLDLEITGNSTSFFDGSCNEFVTA